MALFGSGIVSMLAAVLIGFCSLILSDLRPRFVPATVVLAIALTTIGIGIFAFTPAVWHNWFLPMPLSVALLSASALAIWHRANTRDRLAAGLCPECGYDLRGSKQADVCPECGCQRRAGGP